MEAIVLIKLIRGILITSEVIMLNNENAHSVAERRFLELCGLDPSSEEALEAIEDEGYSDYKGTDVFFSRSEVYSN